MEPTIDFNVSQEVGKWLISRGSAMDLLNKTKHLYAERCSSSNYVIKIDFTGVNFISRSFADQLVKELYSSNQKFILANPKQSITRLLFLASKTFDKERVLSERIYPHFDVKDKHDFYEKLGVE